MPKLFHAHSLVTSQQPGWADDKSPSWM